MCMHAFASLTPTAWKWTREARLPCRHNWATRVPSLSGGCPCHDSIFTHSMHFSLLLFLYQNCFCFWLERRQDVLNSILQQNSRIIYNLMMILTISRVNRNVFLFQNARAAFCQNRDYFENKKMRQKEKIKTVFRHDETKLKQMSINLKALVPNFFTKSLPMKQSQKITMPNKQANAVDNSYTEIQIPLSTEHELRQNLVRLTSKEVRIGRMLECMDSIAGIVGYRHCFGSVSDGNPFVLVTGCVDSINLFEPIYIDQDIKMEGYVNYVGKTSMEIQINLFQAGVLKSNALFTMISRNAKDHTKSYPCPRLIIETLSEPQLSKAKQRKKQAEQHVKRRQIQMAQSYDIKPPKPEDIAVIHNMFLNTTSRQKQSIETEKTLVSNIRLMHKQERNLHHKIFGGFLMREMVETGWVVASRFAGSEDMHIEDITDVYFKAPVEIGSHLKVTGRVSYTRGNIIIVSMQAETETFSPVFSRKKCCHLQIFLKCNKEQKKVFPKTYQNGIYYLTSRNLFKHAFPTLPV